MPAVTPGLPGNTGASQVVPFQCWVLTFPVGFIVVFSTPLYEKVKSAVATACISQKRSMAY